MALTFTPFASDNFTRANAGSLGANWALPASGTIPGCQIVSNVAEGTTVSGNNFNTYSAIPGYSDFPWDQYSTVTIGTLANSTCVVGTSVRITSPSYNSGVTPVGYFLVAQGGGNHALLRKLSGGSFTTLLTGTTNVLAGDTLTLAVQGSTLSLIHNGISEGTVSDSTFVYGWPGILIAPDTTLTNATLTNWVAGAVSTPPTIVHYAPALQTGTIANLGTLTAVGQAVQFNIATPSLNFAGRLQIIVQGVGQVIAPYFVLEGSQDGGTTWFQIPGTLLPSVEPMLGDQPSGWPVWYDVSGLAMGGLFRFGISSQGIPTSGVSPTFVSGSLNVYGLVG